MKTKFSGGNSGASIRLRSEFARHTAWRACKSLGRILALLFLIDLGVSADVYAAPKPGDFLTQGSVSEKKIALTLDDGPGPHTHEFLALLDKYQVKATFFVLGEQSRSRPKLTKEIAEKGHELANHTMTHMNYNKRYKFRLGQVGNPEKAAALTKEDLVKDMKEARAIIEKNSGQKLKLLRMPYGIDKPWIKQAAHEAGFVILNWTYGTDWNPAPAAEQIPGYINAIKPGAVILLHDGWPKTMKSLEITEAVIKAAKEKGFEIVTAGELLGL